VQGTRYKVQEKGASDRAFFNGKTAKGKTAKRKANHGSSRILADLISNGKGEQIRSREPIAKRGKPHPSRRG
jgi:hypothetical protein